MQIYRDGKPLDGPNGQVLILGEAPALVDQEVPLRLPIFQKRLVRDHGYKGWADDYFDVADVFDVPQEKATARGTKFDLEAAVHEIDVGALMGYERVVTLGRAWTAVHEALNRRSEEEGIDFQNDMCSPCQVAGYKWLRVLRWPEPNGLLRCWVDEDECEWTYMVYRAFVGLVVDRTAVHMNDLNARGGR